MRLLLTRIAISIAVGSLAALAVVANNYRQPEKFAASATVLIVQDPAPLNPLVMREASPFAMLRGVYESQSFKDRVAEKAGLEREKLTRGLSMVAQAANATVTLSCASFGSEKNLEVVQTATKELLSVTKDSVVGPQSSRAKEMKVLVDQTEQEVRDSMDEVSRLLAGFKTKAVAREVLARLDAAKSERIKLDGELSQRKKAVLQQLDNVMNVATDQVEINRLRDRYFEVKNQLEKERIASGEEAPKVMVLRESLAQASADLQKAVADYRRGVVTHSLHELQAVAAKIRRVDDSIAQDTRLLPLTAAEESKLAQAIARRDNLLVKQKAAMDAYGMVQVQSMADSVRWSVLDPGSYGARPMNRGVTTLAAGPFLLVTALAWLGLLLLGNPKFLGGWRMKRREDWV